MFPKVLSFSFRVLLLLVLAVTGVPKELQKASVSKPGCPSQCGNLTVPYPFGISHDCSLNSGFTLHCDNSSNPHKAFIKTPLTQFEVLHISASQVQIRNNATFLCFNRKGQLVSNLSRVVFNNIMGDFPYTLSTTDNRFFVIGCNVLGFLTEVTGGLGSSCGNICSEEKDIIGGSCLSNGCCQSPIPKGMKSLSISLELTIGHRNVTAFDPCVYGFIGNKNQFLFQGTSNFHQNSIERIVNNVPMVLDWVVGIDTCSRAKQNRSSYVCHRNTECIDVNISTTGYLCRCLPDHEGNPYLSPGCFKPLSLASIGIKESVHPRNGYTSTYSEAENPDCVAPSLGWINSFNNIQGIVRLLTLLVSPIIVYWFCKVIMKAREQTRKTNYFKRNGGLILQQQISSSEGVVEKTTIFSDDEIEKATDNFNENRILGRGGQGTVYKGMMVDGKIVAIKKSRKVDRDQLEEFINEIVILSQINHRNVVRLLGCCLETEVPLLVYEFVSNGTLYQHMQEPIEEFQVTWKTRLQIAAEVAGALAYLHSSCCAPIYHRDIKSANILLDDKYKAKISDFGISKVIDIDQTHVTTDVRGTFGYLDPEYYRTNSFTDKSDVYSFGVVLVELITGKKPAIATTAGGWTNLASEFLIHMENSSVENMLDSRVLEDRLKEEFMDIAKLAKWCLESNGIDRPTMKEVTTVLEGIKSKHSPSSVDPGYVETDHSTQDDQDSILNASAYPPE